MPTTKIATCCYCGTRAALVLKGERRHELSCSTCGAPLHEMKMLREDAHGPRDLVQKKRSRQSDRSAHKKKKKRRKSLRAHVLEEVWDAIEDIFD